MSKMLAIHRTSGTLISEVAQSRVWRIRSSAMSADAARAARYIVVYTKRWRRDWMWARINRIVSIPTVSCAIRASSA